MVEWLKAGTNALGLGYNIFSNERNFKAQQRQQELENERYIENRDYQRALQERVFEREDSAIQRAVQDAEKAGLSPLSVAGNGASSGALVGSMYQAPASGQASFSPVDVMSIMRGMQEMQLAQDANQRAERETNANIAFQQASLEQSSEKMGMDFMLRNAEIFNNYQLASEELRQRGVEFDFSKKKWLGEQNNFEKRLLFDIEKLRSDNMRFASEFQRQGLWRQEDIDHLDNQFKWQKGNDTIDNIMNFGNLLVDIFGVLNGGNRR